MIPFPTKKKGKNEPHVGLTVKIRPETCKTPRFADIFFIIAGQIL